MKALAAPMNANPKVAVGPLPRALICWVASLACWCFAGSVIKSGFSHTSNAVSSLCSYLRASRRARLAKMR